MVSFPPKNKPLIEGRIPSKWLFDNGWRISQKDFYNFDLSEKDLKSLYPPIPEGEKNKPQEINESEFKNLAIFDVLRGEKLTETVDDFLKKYNLKMGDRPKSL